MTNGSGQLDTSTLSDETVHEAEGAVESLNVTWTMQRGVLSLPYENFLRASHPAYALFTE